MKPKFKPMPAYSSPIEWEKKTLPHPVSARTVWVSEWFASTKGDLFQYRSLATLKPYASPTLPFWGIRYVPRTCEFAVFEADANCCLRNQVTPGFRTRLEALRYFEVVRRLEAATTGQT